MSTSHVRTDVSVAVVCIFSIVFAVGAKPAGAEGPTAQDFHYAFCDSLISIDASDPPCEEWDYPPGDGLTEVAYMALLAEILNDPASLHHAEVQDAWDAALAELETGCGMPESMAVGWAPILIYTRQTAQEVAAISPFSINLDDYTQLPEILSAQGDADGDGVCNLAEYNAWNGWEWPEGTLAFAAAATDPAVTDDGGGCTGEVIEVPEIVQPPRPRTWVEKGTDVTLTVQAGAVAKTGPLHYHWYKDGVFLDTAPDAPTLDLPCVTSEDEGTYTCAVYNEWGTAMSAAAQVDVAMAGLPAAGPGALLLLAAALGYAAARRNRSSR